MQRAAELLDRRARGEGLGVGLGSTFDAGANLKSSYSSNTRGGNSDFHVGGGLRTSLDPARFAALVREAERGDSSGDKQPARKAKPDAGTLELLALVRGALQKGLSPREDAGEGGLEQSGQSEFEFDVWARTKLARIPLDEDFGDEDPAVGYRKRKPSGVPPKAAASAKPVEEQTTWQI